VATEDDVRRLCLALPEVTERPSWSQPAWFRGAGRGTLFARMWEDGVVTVKTEERDVLAGANPETFYWTPHHDGSPLLVLVRLERVEAAELEELVKDSYRLAG
jgi:hypothetical protein